MAERIRRVMIYMVVTLFIIVVFLSLFFDLRDLLYRDNPLPYTVETACGLSHSVRW